LTIFSKGKEHGVSESINQLNEFHLEKDQREAILSSFMRYNQKNNRIIQVPLFLNYFNIFNIDGSFCKTVCLGNQIMEIDSEIKSLPNNFFYDVRTYEKFFVVMCEIDGQRSLRFFSYDGKPLYNLEYNASATRFDIDMQNNILYLLDYENDTVEFFDISNIIDSVYNLM